MAYTVHEELVSIALELQNAYYAILQDAKDLRLNGQDNSIPVASRENYANKLEALENLVERYDALLASSDETDANYDSAPKTPYLRVDVRKYGSGFGSCMGAMLEALRVAYNNPLHSKKATKPLSLSLRRGMHPGRYELELIIIGFHIFLSELKVYNSNLADDIDSKVAPLFTMNLLTYVFSEVMDPIKLRTTIMDMHRDKIISLMPLSKERKAVTPTEYGRVLKSNVPVDVPDFAISLSNFFAVRMMTMGRYPQLYEAVGLINGRGDYKTYKTAMAPYIIKELKYNHYDKFNKPRRITAIVDAIRIYVERMEG